MKGTAVALGLLLAGAPAWGADPSTARIEAAVERVAGRPGFAAAHWGIEVRSLATGRVLHGRNAGRSVTPASTLKLVTTAAALDALGPEARVYTTVETAASQDAQGRILGDVYLVGRGDPNLSGRFTEGRVTAAFEAMAAALTAAGVRRIEGRLVGHEGRFPGPRRVEGWSWDDLVWWYGAEVSALCFNDNSADLRILPGLRVGDPVIVDWKPASAYYQVSSSATTSGSGSEEDLVLERDLGSNRIRLSGTYPLGGPPHSLAVALEDPARYAATVFSEVLAEQGILLTGGIGTSSGPLPPDLRVLAAQESRPVAELIQPVNKRSQNLHAELLLRILGAHASGSGTLEAGLAALRAFLQRAGVAIESWDLQDGSGLARTNLVTPHDLVSVLAFMDRHPHGQAYRASLPIAGVDGSLKNRMRGTAAQGRVLAKTGSLRHTDALAGYLTTRSGARLAFAIVLDRHTRSSREALAAIDEIVAALAES